MVPPSKFSLWLDELDNRLCKWLHKFNKHFYDYEIDVTGEADDPLIIKGGVIQNKLKRGVCRYCGLLEGCGRVVLGYNCRGDGFCNGDHKQYAPDWLPNND